MIALVDRRDDFAIARGFKLTQIDDRLRSQGGKPLRSQSIGCWASAPAAMVGWEISDKNMRWLVGALIATLAFLQSAHCGDTVSSLPI
jgi:hypothetical protein